MKRSWMVSMLLIGCGSSGGVQPGSSPAKPVQEAVGAPQPPYPATRRAETAEEKHGVRVPDPYRWLEEDGPETRAWIAAQNRATDEALATIDGRQAMKDRVAQLMRREWVGLPIRRGARFFWVHGDGKNEQPVLLTASSPDAPPKVLLDPNQISTDGSLAFAGYSPSENGRLVAYGLATGGGDWTTWRIRDVATGADLPEKLEFAKYYRPRFTRDGKAIIYSRFPAPPEGKEILAQDRNHKVLLHRLGTPVEKDIVLFERPDQPTWQFDPTVTRDGRYLVITMGDGQVGDSSKEQVAVLDLDRPGARPTMLIDRYEEEYLFVGNDGPRMFFKTTLGAERKRIIAIDVRKPAREGWEEVVPQGASPIENATVAGGQLLVTTLVDAHSAVTAYGLDGKKLREIALPGIGTVFGIAGGPRDPEATFHFTSFTVPGTVYRCDLRTGATRPWKAPRVPFDPSLFETKQVFFPSKDGTKVPMFITARKGLPLDGENPAIMTGYGFGGISSTPAFNPADIAWLERGGISVVVNIRGGGEYGTPWHHAALRERRQVGVNDFLAAAEWLARSKHTSSRKLGAIGYSGGGSLVGAAVVQRPDLFGAVVPVVGVHDMMRFHLFGQGAGWQADMGSPDDPVQGKALLALSPLHNVRPGTAYPPVLVVTSDHDVRVAPHHSYKFAAALQWAQAAPARILLRVQTMSGHGGGSMLSQAIEQQAEILSFFSARLGAASPAAKRAGADRAPAIPAERLVTGRSSGL
jgi:prolyl oligopeptidase